MVLTVWALAHSISTTWKLNRHPHFQAYPRYNQNQKPGVGRSPPGGSDTSLRLSISDAVIKPIVSRVRSIQSHLVVAG